MPDIYRLGLGSCFVGSLVGFVCGVAGAAWIPGSSIIRVRSRQLQRLSVELSVGSDDIVSVICNIFF